MIAELSTRWMNAIDLDAVLAIEVKSFEYAWDADNFIEVLRGKEHHCMVVEIGDTIAGYFVYLKQSRLRVASMAVAPRFRRQGIGRFMFQKLIDELDPPRFDEIEACVLESNLPAQLFLREMGMIAIRIEQLPWSGREENTYVFSYIHRRE